MRIQSLSVELVENIYRHLDPASHLRFALTDKHIFAFSNGVLERHQKYHQFYHSDIDQNPESLAILLENVVQDHIAAWHGRHFEGFIARPGNMIGFAHDTDSIRLAKRFYSAMTANGCTPFKLDRIRIDGYLSEVLQTAILALSTGLHTIKATLFPPALGESAKEEDGYNLWADDDFDAQQYNEDGSHSFFSNVIRAYYELKVCPMWPPGFENLHTVVIGIPFSTAPGRPGHMVELSERLSPVNVAPIFLLPNIRSVYLWGLYENNSPEADEEPFGPNFTLLANSSSLEHLFLERAHTEDVKHAINTIIKSSKGLKSLILKDCELHDFDQTVVYARDTYRDPLTWETSLTTLLWSEANGQLTGYRSSKFYIDEILPDMRGIRVLALDMGDVFLCCMAGDHGDERTDQVEGYNFTPTEFFEFFSQTVLEHPHSLEVLVFKAAYEGFYEGAARAINDAIIYTIKEAFIAYEDEEDDVEEDQNSEDDGDDEEEGGSDQGEKDGTTEDPHTHHGSESEGEEEKKAPTEETVAEGGSHTNNDDNEKDEVWDHDLSPISLRHIYLDEVVDNVVKEGIRLNKDEYISADQLEKDRVFGMSLFQEAALKCEGYGIKLHLEEGATALYFRKTCEDIFKL